MIVAFDTNLLVYAAGVNGPERRSAASRVFTDWIDADWILPAHVGVELFRVLIRKGGFSVAAAETEVSTWMARCEIVATDGAVLKSAMRLTGENMIAPLDAIVLASCAHAGCDLLLSEDMQHGFTWRGVAVRNPFRDAPA